MNPNDTTPQDAPPGDDGPQAQAPAPARRRARKPTAADAPVATQATAADGSSDPTPDGDAPTVAKRRARKPAAAQTPPAESTEPSAFAEATGADVEPAAEAAGQSPQAGDVAPSGAEALDPAADDPERGRRGRNRRRGRAKDRAELAGDAGALPGSPGGSAATPPGRPPVARVVVDPAEIAARFGDVVSGAYDAEPPEPDDEASLEQLTKRVLRPDPEAPKLHKVLAQSGVGSRRDMEQLIADGEVTVNDEVAHVGMRVSFGDRIAVKGKPVRVRIQGSPARLLAYHKPVGEVVTFNDPEGRPTVFRRLPRLQHGKWQSVGRLDINTEGLLLFTTSGDLANQLMHPRFGVEREYAVRVLGSLDDEQRGRLLAGVEIEGQTAAFKSIEDGGGEGANRWYRVVITEGRNREVRKLFDKVGLGVSRLIRIRYGTVVLPRGLKRGVWVELPDEDLRAIRQLAAGPTPGGGAAARKDSRPQGGQRRDAPPPRQGPREGAREGRREAQASRPPRREFPGRAGAGEATALDDPNAEDFGRIPNPLEQTFDRRFAKGPRRGPHQGFGHGGSRIDQDDAPGGTIPNPLEQTFDKRFVKGSQRINAGFGRPDGDPHGAPSGGKKGGPKQPDPMQTSVGYIGADAYFNKVGGKRGGHRGGGGGGGGGRRGR